jgi:YidC/Oxa1 family membrane protein insertase
VLIPLTVKQFGSMQKMQQLAPQMKELQSKYKDDKTRQQEEMMKFYRENGVNPLGSCLPLVAQLPVFISLYYMLRTSLRVDICPATQRAHNHGILSTAHTVPCGAGHGASFLFIPDLTNKASGAVLIALIVLYVGTQLASSLMMSSATMDPTQRRMMMLLPLVFVLFVIRFPAGVLVYWITTNTWTMAQQFIIKRRIGPIVAATPGTGSNGAGSGGGGPGSSSGSGQKMISSTRPATPAKRDAKSKAGTSTNGAGGASRSPLAGLLRGRPKDVTPDDTNGAAARSGPPPRPPRKKKKRSGRRR